ncbi:hypothetical protein [Rodentibacter trehalosifermentans]|uniref:hypothetical protein n=1 Tax=Rodentibacter trehalosifermentans TaxID=1908263 RepID=UPI0013F69CA0|nr:hypothetical protein [Rodentibacter trehalosifermentans]
MIDLAGENGIKYLWKDERYVSMENIVYATAEEKQKIKDYQQLLHWQINYLVQSEKNT